jgi:hypothetical protein
VAGIRCVVVIVHHVQLRPTLAGSRIVDVSMDLTAAQLGAGAHAVRMVCDERYRVAALDSADDVLAMRDLTSLADELGALAAPGAINRLTLTVAGVGRFLGALVDFAASRGDGALREGDAAALPVVHGMIDGVEDAHAAALRSALDDSVELSH